ncbi:MAG TPA: hypothetical protein VL443_06335 [Cyclobacteriaceae bacterium]|jgi:hypothetical protein|nr:hypothetical protein [Cyclobacteriaceae bacterium]
MAHQYINQVGYGLSDALPVLAAKPIKANRAPLTSDTGYQIGQIWCYAVTSAVYILVSVANNAATWILVAPGGGAGVFTSLTVNPGPTNLTGVLTQLGTANINATGTAVTTIGSSAGGAVNIASPALTIDSSLAGVVTFADSVTTGSITMGSGLTTGVFNIGNHASSNTLNLKSGTGGTNVISGGFFAVDFLQATSASPTATVVINARQCYANFTGFTTAAAGSQVFTITNSLITTGSSLLVTVNNLGSNDAQMAMTRVQPGAGTVSITCQNLGAAALNGDVNITMWVMD